MTVAITPDRLDALQADAAMYGPSTCMQVPRGEMLVLLAAHAREITCARCHCVLEPSMQPKHCWDCPASCLTCDSEGPCDCSEVTT